MNNKSLDYINFYSSFDSPTKHQLKGLLEQNGWTSRKESREDFELMNEWSEFNLLGDETKPLLTGIIQNPEINYKNLIVLLREANAQFSAELYNQNHQIIYRFNTSTIKVDKA